MTSDLQNRLVKADSCQISRNSPETGPLKTWSLRLQSECLLLFAFSIFCTDVDAKEKAEISHGHKCLNPVTSEVQLRLLPFHSITFELLLHLDWSQPGVNAQDDWTGFRELHVYMMHAMHMRSHRQDGEEAPGLRKGCHNSFVLLLHWNNQL